MMRLFAILAALSFAVGCASGCVHAPKRCADPETCADLEGCTEAEQQSDPEFRVCEAMLDGFKYGFSKGVEACIDSLKEGDARPEPQSGRF